MEIGFILRRICFSTHRYISEVQGKLDRNDWWWWYRPQLSRIWAMCVGIEEWMCVCDMPANNLRHITRILYTHHSGRTMKKNVKDFPFVNKQNKFPEMPTAIWQVIWCCLLCHRFLLSYDAEDFPSTLHHSFMCFFCCRWASSTHTLAMPYEAEWTQIALFSRKNPGTVSIISKVQLCRSTEIYDLRAIKSMPSNCVIPVFTRKTIFRSKHSDRPSTVCEPTTIWSPP